MQTAFFSKFAKYSGMRYLANMLKNKKYKNTYCIFGMIKKKKFLLFLSISAKKGNFNIYVPCRLWMQIGGYPTSDAVVRNSVIRTLRLRFLKNPKNVSPTFPIKLAYQPQVYIFYIYCPKNKQEALDSILNFIFLSIEIQFFP